MKRMIAVLLCVLLLPRTAVRGAAAPFAGGEGTEAKPYLIETEAQLRNVRDYLNAHFRLTADVTVTGSGWEPIGTQADPFTGCFDGDRYTISGLVGSTAAPSAAYQGLFGWNAGTIRNVIVANCQFSATAVGQKHAAYAGAIAAVNSGTVAGCSASGQISATSAAGGLVGKNEVSGSIQRCNSSGTVSSANIAGGIAGIDDGRTKNCCNTGSVSGHTAGGITGQGHLPSCCYNVGTVAGTACGGIVGAVPEAYHSENDGSTCVFLDNTKAGTGNAAPCVKLTDAQMRLSESYAGFDFHTVWVMGGSYPELRHSTAAAPKVLERIEITALPQKTVYTEGEDFSAAGLAVTACYSDGSREAVTDYLLGGYDSTPGDKTVTVSYHGKTVTLVITVKARVPEAITSSVYTVAAGWIRKIPLGTTVSTLRAGIPEKDFIAVYNGDSLSPGNTHMRTGMTVALMDGETVKAALTAVVTGDVTGDGKLTVSDLLAAKAHLLKKSALTGAAAQAADCNADGSITVTDFLLLKAHILGKSTVQAN